MRKNLILFLVCVLAAPFLILSVVSVLWLFAAGANWYGLASPLVVTCGMAASFVPSIVVHELGHLTVAWLVGLRLDSFMLGPFHFQRHGNRFRLRLTWAYFRSVQGFVVALPTQAERLNARMAAMIVAGPLVNLLVGATFLWLAFEVRVSEEGALLTERAWWLGMVGITNLLVGCVNLLPLPLKMGFKTDGAKLLAMVFDRKAGERPNLLLRLMAQSRTLGRRPRDWDAALVEQMLAMRTGTREDAGANIYAFYHALDLGRVVEAGELLDLAFEQRMGQLGPFCEAVVLEAAFFEGLHRRNPVVARTRLSSTKGVAGTDLCARLRAEAAVLLSEGRHAEAVVAAQKGIEALSESPDLGGVLVERDWLQAILSECQQQFEPPQSAAVV